MRCTADETSVTSNPHKTTHFDWRDTLRGNIQPGTGGEQGARRQGGDDGVPGCSGDVDITILISRLAVNSHSTSCLTR